MAKNMWLKRFDAAGDFVARRAFGKYAPGESIVNEDFAARRLRQFYDNRMIVFADVWDAYVNPALVAPRVEKKSTLTFKLPEMDESGTDAEQTGDESETETLQTPEFDLPPLDALLTSAPDTQPLDVVAAILPDVTVTLRTPAVETRESLIADAVELGIDVDKRWSDKTLKEKINAKLA